MRVTDFVRTSDPSGLKLGGPTADNKDDLSQPGTREACRRFEGFLLGEMLKTMRNVDGNSRGLLPVSRAERVFTRQQCEALGEILAQREPLGVARLMEPTGPGSGPIGDGADEG